MLNKSMLTDFNLMVNITQNGVLGEKNESVEIIVKSTRVVRIKIRRF